MRLATLRSSWRDRPVPGGDGSWRDRRERRRVGGSVGPLRCRAAGRAAGAWRGAAARSTGCLPALRAESSQAPARSTPRWSNRPGPDAATATAIPGEVALAVALPGDLVGAAGGEEDAPLPVAGGAGAGAPPLLCSSRRRNCEGTRSSASRSGTSARPRAIFAARGRCSGRPRGDFRSVGDADRLGPRRERAHAHACARAGRLRLP